MVPLHGSVMLRAMWPSKVAPRPVATHHEVSSVTDDSVIRHPPYMGCPRL